MKGSQRRAQLGVSSRSVLREEWRFSASPLLFTPLSVREAQVPNMWTVCCMRCYGTCLHILYWERGLIHSVSRFFFWFGYRQLCCVDVCEYAFSFSAQIYLLEEKHICIKKLQNTGRMSTLFSFCSTKTPPGFGFLWGILKTGFHLKHPPPPQHTLENCPFWGGLHVFIYIF